MRRFLYAALTAGLLVGCSSSGEPEDESSPTPTATPEAQVTWFKDIQPIMQRACMRCHNGEGQAPTDFTKYETAKGYSTLIASYVKNNVMPPAAADPECRDYEGSEARFVTDEEKALFQQWADAGAPEGKSSDATGEPLVFDHTLHDADREMRIEAPYKPEFDPTGNAYICFVVDPQRDREIFVNGFGATVDRNEIVHHMVLYLDRDGNADDKFGGRPFDCMGEHDNPELDGVDNDWEMLAAWGPGGPPIEFDEGYGMKIEPQANLILQMHYFESSPDAAQLTDQSGLSIRTTDPDRVEKEVYYFPLGPYDFNIPAGDASYTATEMVPLVSSPDFQFENIEILAVFPHMHVLGQSYEYYLKRKGNQEECIAQSDRYDFHNQETYKLKEKLVINSGDRLFMSCTWNNSPSNPNLIHNPPVDVQWGEGTDDEMCLFMSYVVFNF